MKPMQMIWTSYFGNVKKLRAKYPTMLLVSIAGKTPDWFICMDKCDCLRSLAPKHDWWAKWHEKFKDDLECQESQQEYIAKYQETVLGATDPQAVNSTLQTLLSAHGSSEVCLLCYETPDKFCHRHLVSKWLEAGSIPSAELVESSHDEDERKQ